MLVNIISKELGFAPDKVKNTVALLDDGATIEGLYRKYKMISFGDSITHGYDAIYPSLSYASQLAQNLDAEQLNKGIGGDIFFPALLDEKDAFEPDFITVAYGILA